MGGSCKVALNLVGATSSTSSCFGVGYNTSNFSMRASQPHCLNCASIHSALALSCGEPTWLGSDDNRFSQSRISLALNSESKRCSSCRCWVVPDAVKPSMPLAPGAAGGVAAPAMHVNDRHASATPTLRTYTDFMAYPSTCWPSLRTRHSRGFHDDESPLLRPLARNCMGQWSRLPVALPARLRRASTPRRCTQEAPRTDRNDQSIHQHCQQIPGQRCGREMVDAMPRGQRHHHVIHHRSEE